MKRFRVQKIIAASGLCSRRKAETLLLEERVSINGSIAKLGCLVDPDLDLIQVDGIKLPNRQAPRVYLLNKPPGFISSCRDQYGRRCVLALLPTDIRYGLHPVGRLDLESRGALLLTNHGELTLRLTHPRYEHVKTYRVWVQGTPSNESLLCWRKGLNLNGKLTIPASVRFIKSDSLKTLLEIQLKEGRKRQIRRVADLIGNPVLDLQRIDIGGIPLGDLSEGSWRELKPFEWNHLI